MRISKIRTKNRLDGIAIDEKRAGKPALLRLFQLESRENPQSLLALMSIGALPFMDGLFDQLLPMGTASGPISPISALGNPIASSTGSHLTTSPSIITTDLNPWPFDTTNAPTDLFPVFGLPGFSGGDDGLSSLGRELGGNPNGLTFGGTSGANVPGSVDSGRSFLPTPASSPASSRTSLGDGTTTSATPAISPSPTKASVQKIPMASRSPGASTSAGTLQLAGPATDIIAPPQRSVPSADSTFTREFVVRLKPGVSSEKEARRYKATHVFAYPHLNNVNLWKIPNNSDATKFARQIRGNPRIIEAYPVYQANIAKTSLMNDPLVPAQWHLFNDGHTGSTANVESNVEAAWDTGMTGKGALISVVDDGLEFSHPDLQNNVVHSASWDFRAGDDDPSPIGSDGHGTSVAGVIAASGNNGNGISGVAPDARIGGSRLIPGSINDTQLSEALKWNTTKSVSGWDGFDATPIDIYNNSWGFVGPADLRAYGSTAATAFSESAALGRGGLGSIYLFAAGNDRVNQDNTNYSTLTNNRYTITVAAVADDGALSSYSNPGASILISGLSNGGYNPIVTTDRTGGDGYSRTSYTDTFGGTSSATPFVSGVVAQMLQANPNLTWRDVQHILVRSSTRVDPGNAEWDANPNLSGVQANGGGRYVNHNYGFGLVNASGAVNLASNWQPVGPELIYTSAIDAPAESVPIPDNDTAGISRVINVPTGSNIRVERVEVIFDTINHAAIGELNITLTSPSGTVSRLAEPRLFGSVVSGTSTTTFTTSLPQDSGSGLVGETVIFTSGANNLQSRTISAYNGTTKEITLSTALPAIPAANDTFSILADYNDWAFTTTHSWDELSAGDWTLNVSDRVGGGITGSLSDWQLRIYGTEIAPDTTGPRMIGITSPNANGMLNGGSVSSFRVQFDTTINAGTFNPSDIVFQQVGGATTAVDTITAVNNPGGNDTTFDVVLTSPVSTVGNYRVDIGPDIADTNGNMMNQDGDLTNGESTADKYSEFFTIANKFIYSNILPNLVPEPGTLIKTINLPAVNISDLNVLMFIYHPWPSWDMSISLESPSVSNVVIAAQNVGNGAGLFDGGYRATVLDDDNGNVPFIHVSSSTLNHYTGQYRPSNPLSAFDGVHGAGDWTLTITDDLPGGNQGDFRFYDLILTPAGVPNIRINSVTNTDGDRDKVEVSYTISNAAPTSFELGVYNSADPFWNTNSDTLTGTFNVTNGADLTEGTHTIELDASLFPDPSFSGNQEFFSLVVADPSHSVLELAKHDNYGLLEGVTQTPDGTLYIAGQPFRSNAITITNSDVTFNTGSPISYNGAMINDIILTGGTEADTVNAAGTTENILAFLGTGNDSYIGGDGTDAVQGGPGHDTILGNAGSDRLYGMSGTDNVDGGADADTVSVGESLGGTQTLAGGTGPDFLLVDGTSYNDRIEVSDPDGDESLIGTSLQVMVRSPATAISGLGLGTVVQTVTISGVESTDTLLVNASYGNDSIELRNPSMANTRVRLPAFLIGGPGNDTMIDGLGADYLYADSASSGLPGDGNDDLQSTDGTPGDRLILNQVGPGPIDTFTSTGSGDIIIEMT